MDHPIVSEELALIQHVRDGLARRRPDKGPDERPIVQELERVREQLVAQPDGKDAMTLLDQWHRQSSLLRQLRASRDRAEVDPLSPYFAHLRLREGDTERDLCLGHATCVEDGLRIVDWRNAPVSRIFYRYQQGDEYEEEFGGRIREGMVAARRTVRIRDSGAPQHQYTRDLIAAVPHPDRRIATPAPEKSAADLLNIEAVSVRYGETTIFPKLFKPGRDVTYGARDVSLNVRVRELLGVVGESGSGKSTIAKVLAGLQDFDGKLRFNRTCVRHSQVHRQGLP